MKTKLLCAIALSSLCLSPLSFANDKVDNVYNAKTYQKVCKGKTFGTWVSFVYRGIIWNGTCEPQFFPNKASAVTGMEDGLYTICASDNQTTTASLNGSELKGKCALGFNHPRPR